MPLFRKSSSGTSALSERYHKALSRCRLLLLKEADAPELLEALAQDEGFKPDVREQIANQTTREKRMAALLDRLENKGDKPFEIFLEALRERFRHLHSVIEETLRGIDESEDSGQRDRIQIPGTLVRKIVRNTTRRKTDYSQGSESADELDLIYEAKEEELYLDCYSIPLKGRQARESWIKHETDVTSDNVSEEETTDATYMATLLKDVFFKRIDICDIPANVKHPPRHCTVYIVDPDQTVHHTHGHQMGLHSKTECKHGHEKEMGEGKKERQSEMTEAQAMQELSHEHPPPVPPKPGFLPALSPRPPILKTRTDKLEEMPNGTTNKPPKLPKPKFIVTENGTIVKDEAAEGNKASSEDESLSSSAAPTPELPPRTHKITVETTDSEIDVEVPNGRPLSLVAEENLQSKEDVNSVEEDPPALPPRGSRKSTPDRSLLPPVEARGTGSHQHNGHMEHQNITGEEDSDMIINNDISLSEQECNNNENLNREDKYKNTPDKQISEMLPNCIEGDNISQEQVQDAQDSQQAAELSDQPETVTADTEEYGQAASVNGDGEGTVEEKDSMYEPITPQEEGDEGLSEAMEKAPAVRSPLDDISESVDDADLEVEVPCELYGTYAEGSVDDKNAPNNQEVQEDTNKPNSRDSGVDITVTNANEESKEFAALPLPFRHRRSMRKRGLPSIPRSVSDSFSLVVPQDSSDEDSYYEDIDQFGTSSPSAISSVSYMDPKSHARALEQALLAQNPGLAFRRRAQARAHRLLREDRLLLRQAELLVADDVLAYQPPAADSPEDNADIAAEWKDTYLLFDKLSRAFYVGGSLFKKHGDPDGEIWFYPVEISSRQAALFLSETRQEGCFLVYRPLNKSSHALYNLSVCRANGDVLHYHILKNIHGDVMLANHDQSFMNVADMVTYFQGNKSRLATRLRRPLREAYLPITPGHHYDIRWEIDRGALSLTGKLIGKGEFGMVCGGMYRSLPVAVKVMQKGDCLVTEEDDFLQEAQMLMTLKHEHIVRLVGVSCTAKPFFLVTEYLAMGNLRDCLRDNQLPMDGLDTLFDVCIQVTSAMYFLENKQFILHRDIAARNCLVSPDMCIKLADFGRAVYVSDGCYQAPTSEKIPIKWAAPEVLAESHYSIKSDIWALGVLYWEILSWGERPYPDLSAEQTTVYVTEGGRLDKPAGCSPDLYAMMKSCWRHEASERPTFTAIYERMKSKSSIYYGPVQPRNSGSGDSGSVKGTPLPPNPPKPRAGSSPRKTATLTSHQEELTHDLLDSMQDDSLVLQHSLATSSSETSLVSSTGMSKDDMSRGDKIRKSLRKMMTVKQKRKNSKLDLSRDNTSRASGQLYI